MTEDYYEEDREVTDQEVANLTNRARVVQTAHVQAKIDKVLVEMGQLWGQYDNISDPELRVKRNKLKAELNRLNKQLEGLV